MSETPHGLLEKLEHLPSLPSVAMKVTELIGDPTTSAQDIADVLKTDQGLTSKVLKMANSSYYAIPGGVSEVPRAIAFLGFSTMAQLVLTASVFSVFPATQGAQFSQRDFWIHALGVGILSENLAKLFKYPRPEEAFTCGLLHDIGKMVLAQVQPELLQKIVKQANEKEISFLDSERLLDAPAHGFLGEIMSKKWKLPSVIGNVIRYHHHEISEMKTFLPSEKKIIEIVAFANKACVSESLGHSGNYSKNKITETELKQMSLTQEQYEKQIALTKTALEKAKELLNA